ncbi:skin secretory protein xP2-like [Hippopotamus amphibius kiboko]|uniref:skin secretory protein xP2-like n=1 Tax=Hippopotamus amphibius kiboko TaxID=575201 RepID=UPI0025973A0D|nr:skin secretory protein xP2-like [Hippopotamus amphibius kiboko]
MIRYNHLKGERTNTQRKPFSKGTLQPYTAALLHLASSPRSLGCNCLNEEQTAVQSNSDWCRWSRTRLQGLRGHHARAGLAPSPCSHGLSPREARPGHRGKALPGSQPLSSRGARRAPPASAPAAHSHTRPGALHAGPGAARAAWTPDPARRGLAAPVPASGGAGGPGPAPCCGAAPTPRAARRSPATRLPLSSASRPRRRLPVRPRTPSASALRRRTPAPAGSEARAFRGTPSAGPRTPPALSAPRAGGRTCGLDSQGALSSRLWKPGGLHQR